MKNIIIILLCFTSLIVKGQDSMLFKNGVKKNYFSVSGITSNISGKTPRTSANYFPTETAVTTINNSKYNFTGLMDYYPDGTIVNIVRQGRIHVGDTGILVMYTSVDQGQTWSTPTTIYSETGVDIRCQGGGITPKGRLIVFFGRYNPAGSAWLNLGYIYSDDKGLTWSTYTTISNGSNTVFAPYGGMQAIAGDSLMMSWYGHVGATYTQYIIKSGDNGATWGTAIVALTSGSSQYEEGSFVYVSGSTIIGLIRNSNGTAYRQVKSTDNGTTWTDVGNTTFETFTSGNCRQGWLSKYLTPTGQQAIVFYYVTQTANLFRSTTGFATDIITGVTGWGTAQTLASMTVGLGYASAIHPFGQSQGFVTYTDESSSTNAPIKFYTAQAKLAPATQLTYPSQVFIDQTNPIKISATMPASASAFNSALNMQITSVSNTQNQFPFNMDYLPGATEVKLYSGFRFSNTVAGTGKDIFQITSGNLGGFASSTSVTVGTNNGLFGNAGNGDVNIGVFGRAIGVKNTVPYGGGLFLGNNTGTSDTSFGVYAGLNTTRPAFAKAAAVFDNSSIAAPITLFRDNGTVVAQVADGGNAFFGGTTTPTAKVHLGAGTTTASTAPLKLTTGTSMTAAEAGAFEYTTPQLFFTNGGAQRQEIPQIQQSRVSSDFTVTSSTALTNVTGLTATLVAGKTYRFTALVYTTSANTGGVKFAIGGTCTATNIIYDGNLSEGGLNVNPGTSRGTALGTTILDHTSTLASYARISGTITVNTAGTLTVQFAQNNSDGTGSIALRGSTFVVTEIL